jgi:hypothetical protein
LNSGLCQRLFIGLESVMVSTYFLSGHYRLSISECSQDGLARRLQKKRSMTALSHQLPLRLMLPTNPYFFNNP